MKAPVSAEWGVRSAESAPAPRVVVFFAVKQEARFFRPLPEVEVSITGIGQRNAERAAMTALAGMPPAFVLTCGFAGGLDPALRLNDLIFDADDGFPLRKQLLAAGAKPAKFHCADRIAVTAAEKAELRRRTRADAVEMESAAIRELCRARGIPSATVRVISDTAEEDMPLDFNRVMTSEMSLSGSRLAGALFRSPVCISGLVRFQRHVTAAAASLSGALQRVLEHVRFH